MAVVVHKDEPIERALSRLHREVVRENVFSKSREKRYRIKASEERIAVRREKKKQKRKHRQFQRKQRNKG